jgi:hypothetical protein
VVPIPPREIAAAIQGHIKALRLLGRERTSVSAIADALHLTDTEVETAFADFKMVGAKYVERTSVSHIRYGTTFSPAIALKQ